MYLHINPSSTYYDAVHNNIPDKTITSLVPAWLVLCLTCSMFLTSGYTKCGFNYLIL